MPANYVKDTTTGKTYKLGSGGYYQEYAGAPTEAPTEAAGLGSYYSNLAKSETDPYYNTQTDITTKQTNADLANTQNRLRALYTDQGMGNSSFYTGADTSATNTSNLGLSGRLADIEKARTGAYQTALGGYTAKQTAGETQDWNAEQARLAAIKKAEDDARALEYARQTQEAQMALLRAQTASYSSSGGGGGGTSKVSLNSGINSLGSIVRYDNGGVQFGDANMTREQAAWQLADATGVSYQTALNKIYSTFKSSGERAPAPVKSAGVNAAQGMKITQPKKKSILGFKY